MSIVRKLVDRARYGGGGGGSAPVMQEKSVTITANGTQDITPDAGYDGMSKASVTVDVPEPEISLQDKTVTENGRVTADSGYDGLRTVEVNVPDREITKELLAALDSDFIPENIKKDVDLFGLIGTLESGAVMGEYIPAEDIALQYYMEYNTGDKEMPIDTGLQEVNGFFMCKQATNTRRYEYLCSAYWKEDDDSTYNIVMYTANEPNARSVNDYTDNTNTGVFVSGGIVTPTCSMSGIHAYAGERYVWVAW